MYMSILCHRMTSCMYQNCFSFNNHEEFILHILSFDENCFSHTIKDSCDRNLSRIMDDTVARF